MGNDQISSTNKVDRVLLIVLAMSLIANVSLTYLLQRNRIQHPVIDATAQNLSDARSIPKAGARLDELHLIKQDGTTPDIKLDSHELPIIVYVLSPTCGWCKLNRPNINSLVTQVQGKYRVVGISVTSLGLENYVVQNSLPFQVYSVDPKFSHANFPLKATPETLVFSSEGILIRGWNGAYLGDTKDIVSSYFGIKLPV